MTGLSPELYQRCRTTLLQCGEFDSDESLRAVFVTAELSPFRNAVPEGMRKANRVDGCLAYLLSKRLRDGRVLLPIFLETLSGKYQEGDALREELAALTRDTQSLLNPAATQRPSSAVTVSSSPQAQAGCPELDAPAALSPSSVAPEQKETAPVVIRRGTPFHMLVFASGLLGFLMGVLGNLVAAWIQQDVLSNMFTPATIVSIVILTIIGLISGVFLQHHLAESRLLRIPFVIVVAVVTGAIILAVVIAVQLAAAKPPTVHFVVDATQNTQSFFDDIRKQVLLTSAAIPANSHVGLRIYGGQRSGRADCQDTVLLLNPGTYEDLVARLDSSLINTTPSGSASLTVAILDALTDDLSKQEDPRRLIVITSGPDPRCDPMETGILESRVKDLTKPTDIFVISVGDLSTGQMAALESYARVFGGRHYNIKTPEALPNIIESVSSYGSTYFLGSLTPTP